MGAIEEFKAKGGVVGGRRREKAEAKREVQDKRAAKRARRERDADKPKKPPSAYWLWLSDNRPVLTKEAGTAGVAGVAKLAGEKWNKIDAKTQARYQKMADEKKAVYDKEMKAAEGGDDADDDDDEPEEDDE